jgi:hypothetical protein
VIYTVDFCGTLLEPRDSTDITPVFQTLEALTSAEEHVRVAVPLVMLAWVSTAP